MSSEAGAQVPGAGFVHARLGEARLGEAGASPSRSSAVPRSPAAAAAGVLSSNTALQLAIPTQAQVCSVPATQAGVAHAGVAGAPVAQRTQVATARQQLQLQQQRQWQQQQRQKQGGLSLQTKETTDETKGEKKNALAVVDQSMLMFGLVSPAPLLTAAAAVEAVVSSASEAGSPGTPSSAEPLIVVVNSPKDTPPEAGALSKMPPGPMGAKPTSGKEASHRGESTSRSLPKQQHKTGRSTSAQSVSVSTAGAVMSTLQRPGKATHCAEDFEESTVASSDGSVDGSTTTNNNGNNNSNNNNTDFTAHKDSTQQQQQKRGLTGKAKQTMRLDQLRLHSDVSSPFLRQHSWADLHEDNTPNVSQLDLPVKKPRTRRVKPTKLHVSGASRRRGLRPGKEPTTPLERLASVAVSMSMGYGVPPTPAGVVGSAVSEKRPRPTPTPTSISLPPTPTTALGVSALVSKPSTPVSATPGATPAVVAELSEPPRKRRRRTLPLQMLAENVMSESANPLVRLAAHKLQMLSPKPSLSLLTPTTAGAATTAATTAAAAAATTKTATLAPPVAVVGLPSLSVGTSGGGVHAASGKRSVNNSNSGGSSMSGKKHKKPKGRVTDKGDDPSSDFELDDDERRQLMLEQQQQTGRAQRLRDSMDDDGDDVSLTSPSSSIRMEEEEEEGDLEPNELVARRVAEHRRMARPRTRRRRTYHDAPRTRFRYAMRGPNKQQKRKRASSSVKQPRKRSADISDLDFVEYLIMDSDKSLPVTHAWRRIRVWINERNMIFYDCECGRRKPVQDLNKIKKHATEVEHVLADAKGNKIKAKGHAPLSVLNTPIEGENDDNDNDDTNSSTKNNKDNVDDTAEPAQALPRSRQRRQVPQVPVQVDGVEVPQIPQLLSPPAPHILSQQQQPSIPIDTHLALNLLRVNMDPQVLSPLLQFAPPQHHQQKHRQQQQGQQKRQQ
ncbi:MAG: hypothetical protein MHM6MM_002895 [Cercozoa sp. M6MM]